jgi:drug/metabolite transporter (DMT)-like permease
MADETPSQGGRGKQEGPRPPSFSAALLAASLSVAFGANAVAIKMSLSGIGPFTNAGLRFTLASATLFLFARLTRRSLKVEREQMGNLFYLTILFVLQFSFMYVGIDKSNASRATLMINLQPFFVLFLAHFLIPGDRMSLRKLLALVLGFSGVALAFFEEKGVSSDFRTGDLLMLLTTLIWAFRTVYMKRIIHAFGTFELVLYPMMLSVPIFLIEGYLWDKSMVSALNTGVVTALLYQGLLMASFGFLGWNYLLHKHGAVWLNSFNFVMPVTGVLLGGLLLGEPLTVKIWLALSLVTAGILVVQGRHQRSVSSSRAIRQ